MNTHQQDIISYALAGLLVIDLLITLFVMHLYLAFRKSGQLRQPERRTVPFNYAMGATHEQYEQATRNSNWPTLRRWFRFIPTLVAWSVEELERRRNKRAKWYQNHIEALEKRDQRDKDTHQLLVDGLKLKPEGSLHEIARRAVQVYGQQPQGEEEPEFPC